VTAPRAVFVDTGAWVALRYKRDQHHARARTLLQRLRAQHLGLITTEWVLAETVTLLKARGAVEHAIVLGRALQAGQLGVLLESTAERRASAWSLFERYRKLRVGWVDCASFAVMEELGLQHFFGFDEDFIRAGFKPFR